MLKTNLKWKVTVGCITIVCFLLSCGKLAEKFNNRGIQDYNKSNINKAITNYNIAIKLNPKSGEIYYNRGNAYVKNGDLDKAITDFTKAIELNPQYAKAYGNRGGTYADMGYYNNAIADFNKAVDNSPEYLAYLIAELDTVCCVIEAFKSGIGLDAIIMWSIISGDYKPYLGLVASDDSRSLAHQYVSDFETWRTKYKTIKKPYFFHNTYNKLDNILPDISMFVDICKEPIFYGRFITFSYQQYYDYSYKVSYSSGRSIFAREIESVFKSELINLRLSKGLIDNIWFTAQGGTWSQSKFKIQGPPYRDSAIKEVMIELSTKQSPPIIWDD